MIVGYLCYQRVGCEEMQIPDQYVGWGGAIVGTIVAWLVRLEARLHARPTRTEQEAIAARVAADVKGQFDDVKRMLEKQNEQTALHRELVGASLAEIRTKVAVLRDRAGDDALEETGAHRRRL
jgi:hypothetical protein